jgi:LacI family transcriptional regulator
MKDIAAALKVSIVTVSKALRNHRDISAATKKRIHDKIRELNYQPNLIARGLVTRRSFIVGLVVPDLTHSFFADVARGVAAVLHPKGYHLVIANTDDDPVLEEQETRLLLARQVDGLILASARRKKDTRSLQDIRNMSVPLVLIDRLLPGVPASFVGVDDEALGRLATEHLIERGCRRIAHIRGPAITNAEGRLRGFRSALAKARLVGLTGFVAPGGDSEEDGFRAMRQLLARRKKPDGVFCFNDPLAVGAMKAILDARLRIPDDVAIIGAGNIHYSDFLKIPLSTVDQSSSQIGENAAALLLPRIETDIPLPEESVVIPPRIVARESTLGASGVR